MEKTQTLLLLDPTVIAAAADVVTTQRENAPKKKKNSVSKSFLRNVFFMCCRKLGNIFHVGVL